MNATGCGYLMATDDLFLYQSENVGSCSANYVIWIVLAVVTLAMKVVSVVLLFKLWFRRRSKQSKDGGSKHSRSSRTRLPVVPSFAFIGLVAHTLFWVLAGLNITSGGYAAPIFLIMWLTFVLPWIIYILKFVKLGMGANPRLRKWNQRAAAQHSKLTRLDPFGRVLFCSGLLSLLGASVSLGIIAPILSDDIRPFLAGVAFQGTLTFSFGVLIDVQNWRLQQSIKEALVANSGVLVEEARADFQAVYKRLVSQRLVGHVTNLPITIIAVLISAQVIRMHYWLISLLFVVESASMFSVTLSNFAFKAASQHRTDTSNSSKVAVLEGDAAVPAGSSFFFSSGRENKGVQDGGGGGIGAGASSLHLIGSVE